MLSNSSGSITTNDVSVRRLPQLESRYSVFKYNVGRRTRKSSMEAIRAAASGLDVLSACMTSDGFLYALATCDHSRSDLTVDFGDGKSSPMRMAWADVDDVVLCRLLLNSLGDPSLPVQRIVGLSPSDTGRYFSITKTLKNRIVAVELSFERRGGEIALIPRVRTFTKVATLLKYAGKSAKEREKIDQAPKFQPSESMGTMVSAAGGDEAYAIRRPRGCNSKSQVALMQFLNDEDKLASTKLAVMDSAMRGIAYRFEGCVELEWKAYAVARHWEIEPSKALKARIAEQCLGARVAVVDARSTPPADGLEAELAAALAKSCSRFGVAAGTAADTQAAAWRIAIVEDERSFDDGYRSKPGPVVQHVTESLAKKVIEEASDASAASSEPAMALSLLKELLAKRDIANGRADGIRDWVDVGADRVSCCKLVEKRVKTPDGDLFESHLATMELLADGTTAFRALPECDAAFDDELEDWVLALCRQDADDMSLDPGAVGIAIEKGGSSSKMVIRDAGVMVIPNAPAEMLDDLRAGVKVRGERSGLLGKYLSGVIGISKFIRDGEICYSVGSAKNLAQNFPKAVRVRSIEILEGDDLADEAISLCNAGLARLGRPSVVPILSKYLDEYAATLFETRMGDEGEGADTENTEDSQD